MMAHGIHLFSSITPDDIIYNSLPLYHTNGGILAAGQMLFWGSTLVLRKKFSASNFFVDCVKHKCTVSRKLSRYHHWQRDVYTWGYNIVDF